jgi:gamma-glutamyltranspeptidase/glutathione hydrolase
MLLLGSNDVKKTRRQSRSEVMAQHGKVVTSQPLAAQAGLQILMRGGNAIDAAVATAAVLNVVEPMMVGVGGDLFAIIYTAKDRKIHVLNASGMAPTGASLAHTDSPGASANRNLIFREQRHTVRPTR